jgi:hypothetical protein
MTLYLHGGLVLDDAETALAEAAESLHRGFVRASAPRGHGR